MHFPQNTPANSAASAANPLALDPFAAVKSALSAGHAAQAFALLQQGPQTQQAAALYSEIGLKLRAPHERDLAYQAYEKACEICPKDANPRANLAILDLQNAREDRAIQNAKTALKIDPKCLSAQVTLAEAYTTLGLSNKTERALKAARKIAPQNPHCHVMLARFYHTHGQTDEARRHCETALKAMPDQLELHYFLAQITAYTPEHPHLAQLASLHRKYENTPQACYTAAALAIAFEQIGELDAAFAVYEQANAARRHSLNYSFQSDAAVFAQSANSAPALLQRSARDPKPSDGPCPIFIVGLPRSGTSLMAQILTSHPLASGGAEYPFATRFGEAMTFGQRPITDENIAQFRQDYLNGLKPIGINKPYFVDKMPQNFLVLPALAAAFPEAKFIHMKRSAAATLWSNFKLQFKSDGLGFTMNLNDLRQYFAGYAALMSAWKTLMPHRILDVSYETLTEAPETTITSILDTLELPFHAACLSPQSNRSAMATASAAQVKSGIYTGSSQSWKKFETHIAGRFDGLDDLPR